MVMNVVIVNLQDDPHLLYSSHEGDVYHWMTLN